MRVLGEYPNLGTTYSSSTCEYPIIHHCGQDTILYRKSFIISVKIPKNKQQYLEGVPQIAVTSGISTYQNMYIH